MNPNTLHRDLYLAFAFALGLFVLNQLVDPKDLYFRVDEHWSVFGIGESTPVELPAREVREGEHDVFPHIVQTIRVYPPKLIQDRFWPSNNFNDE